MNKPTQYSLEVRQLETAYQHGDELPDDTSIISITSDSPFGAISVGDSITDGPKIDFIGFVGHVNHMIGEFGDGTNMHLTRVYLNPED